MSEEKNIRIKGARINNLKNIDIEIPRDQLVVITGLSGSGKSSLAFDTLYAEGQRRYVESLSAYARQFLGRMSKPECDYIKGIPPAIAIEQRVNSRNPRSTVGTSTEIYEYFRLLFARIGKTISPLTGLEVRKHQVSDIVDAAMQYAEGTRFAIYTPILPNPERTTEEQLLVLQKEGYTRVEIAGKLYRIEEVVSDSNLAQTANKELLIDRLVVSKDKNTHTRIVESAETAFFESHGICIVKFYPPEGVVEQQFTKKFEADGMVFQEPSESMFSFNNPLGACPTCEGFGKVVGVDENLVIPNKTLSVYEGAVVCWKGDKMKEWLMEFVNSSAAHNFPIHRPYFELTKAERDLLWHGAKGVYGIDSFFKFVEENIYKIQYRVMNARYRGKTVCPTCHGSRLKPEAMYVQIGGKNVGELVTLPINELQPFFDNLVLDKQERAIGKRLLLEIQSRLQFLLDVGLGYLSLDRLSISLSGGESQRINLATSLGSSLVGSLYILDEPSIGLHSRDTYLLIKVLHQLKALGNTVVVVEHDEEIIRAADYIIDIGPNAGRLGGEVVYQGNMKDLRPNSNSHTIHYLLGEEKIEVPSFRRPWNNFIEVAGARQNNLKGFTVRFPLNVITVVTGVSGSGKSTLVRDVFIAGMRKYFDDSLYPTVGSASLTGDMHLVGNIEYVDQNSIGRSSRSNPVTYIGAYDEIRKLYATQPLAKQLGYTAAFFSFNKEGGRCENCKGEGTITVEMQFMADLTLECEDCRGKRFKNDLLEVQYHGANVFDVLEMTVNQAIDFFGANESSQERKIVKKLKPLQAVGLGYIKLGQSSSTLSGGENQRVKLAYYLGHEKQRATLFVFDEPTTGLHFHDIKTLLKAFNALIEKGHTVVIIEHNMEVIKCADHLIDLGPEGGKFGGNLVVAGTPEEVVACEASYTGRFLKEKL
jgi:excinuclease ABC subunit A